MESCQRGSYILMRPGGFDIYTDHRNLVYLISSDVKITDAKKQASERIERWRTLMQRFNYRIHHIPGTTNVFADMLSRIRAFDTPGVSEFVRQVCGLVESTLGMLVTNCCTRRLISLL